MNIFDNTISLEFEDDFEDQGHDVFPLIPEDDFNKDEISFPDTLPIMPLRNTVLFPGVIIPISLGRRKSLRLIRSVMKKDKIIGIVAQKDPKIENPKFEDVYEIGTIAKVLKIFEMPNGSSTAIIQGRTRFRIIDKISDNPNLIGKIEVLRDELPTNSPDEFDALISSIKEFSIKIIELSDNIPNEAGLAIRNINSPLFLINFICSNSDISSVEKQKLLEIQDMKTKAEVLLGQLTREIQKLELKDDIRNKVRNDMDKQQREYFLNEQIKALQDELGTEDSTKHEIEELEKEAKKHTWSAEVEKVFTKQLKRLRQINPMSPDYSLQLDYLRTLVELPWENIPKINSI